MVLVLARSAEAQELPSPLDVTTVVRLARERRQEVVARAARARARAQRPTIDGSIEQPMAMLSIDHLPFTFEGADFSVMLQQDFPLSGLLGRRRAAAEASARRALADVARLPGSITRGMSAPNHVMICWVETPSGCA